MILNSKFRDSSLAGGTRGSVHTLLTPAYKIILGLSFTRTAVRNSVFLNRHVLVLPRNSSVRRYFVLRAVFVIQRGGLLDSGVDVGVFRAVQHV